MKLQGLFPPVTTSFDHKGDLYEVKVRHNIEKYNQTALNGYVVCGSTGESVFLTTPEKIKMFEWVAQYATGGRTLIAGSGAESVRETVEITNKAAEFGYDVALVRNSHYYKKVMSCPEAQEVFFRAVADQSKIPVLIYNFPQVTGIEVAAETIAALSHHPNIIGMKESSGSVEKIAAVVKLAKPGFQVLAGSAQTFAASLAAGAVGGVLAFSNAAPFATISIWEAFRTRELDAAEDWQNRIKDAADLVTTKYGIPGLKHAMDVNGFYGGPVRLPFVPISPEAREEIERGFHGLRG